MELIYRTMPTDYTLVCTSDWHLGALNCNKDAVRSMIDKVERKRNYFMESHGDLIEAILPADKRYASCSIDYKDKLMSPADQAEAVVEMCRPIRRKIVAVGHGNHEYALINTQDFGRYVAAQLQVPYGSACFKFVATDKQGAVMHKFFVTHGRGNLPHGAKDPIQRKANREAALRRKLEVSGHGDCVVMLIGHTHQLIVVRPTTADQIYLTDDRAKLHQHYQVLSEQNASYIPPDSRWYGNTGSFLKLYSPPGSYAIGYAEMAGYAPSEIGWLEVHVQDGKVVEVEKVVA